MPNQNPYYVTGLKPLGYDIIRRHDLAVVASSADYRLAMAAAKALNLAHLGSYPNA